MAFLTIAALFAASLTAGPQTGTVALDGVRSRLEAAPVLRAEFSQTRHISALKRPLLTKGRFVLSQQDGIVWRVEQPHPVTYVLRRNGILEISASGAETFRDGSDSPAMRRILALVRTLSTGDSEAVASMFDIEAQLGKPRWQLALTPKPGQLAQRMRTIQAGGATHVESISIVEPNGDSTIIEFRLHRVDSLLNGEERRLLQGN